MASQIHRIASSLLILFFSWYFFLLLLPILCTLYSTPFTANSFLPTDHNTEEISLHLFLLLYTMPRLFPCSCIILFSYILPLIYKGCQFLTGLLLKTPLRVSSLRALIFLSDINCPVPFAFLLEASSIHLFFQKSWNICYKGIPNKIVSLGKNEVGLEGAETETERKQILRKKADTRQKWLLVIIKELG